VLSYLDIMRNRVREQRTQRDMPVDEMFDPEDEVTGS